MLDRDLDRIAILLMKLSEDDKYKEELEKEYRTYREILEFIPRQQCTTFPDALQNSVIYFEIRLVRYIINGTLNNPITSINPTIMPLINNDDDKKAVLDSISSNISFVTSKRQQISILKKYLTALDLDNIDIDKVKSTLELVESEYNECMIFSNELEQEIAKVRYYYVLALIYANRLSEVSLIIPRFDTDMSLFIHTHHINTIDRLLRKNRAESASMLYNFLNDYKSDKIYDLDFWISLAQIEKEGFALPKSEPPKQSDDNDEENSKQVELITQEKKSFWDKIFNGRFSKYFGNHFKNGTIECFYIPEESIIINIKLFPGFSIIREDFNSFLKFMKRISKKEAWERLSKIIINCEKGNSNKQLAIDEFIGFNAVLNNFDEFICSTNTIDLIDLSKYHDEIIIPEKLFFGVRVKNIYLFASTEKIEKSAFEDCIHLESVTGLQGVLYIGERAFAGCTSLEKLDGFYDSEYGYVEVEKEAFYSCKNLTQVVGLRKTRIIKERTFYDCKRLKIVDCENVEIIEDEAFYGCSRFLKFNISNNLTRIGNKAFYDCSALSSFTFSTLSGENVDSESFYIGEEAFAKTGLRSIHIDDSRVCIEERAFAQSKLVKAEIISIKKLSHGAFMQCENLEEVHLPLEIETIPADTFKDCKSLKRIEIPPNVSKIESNCFENCQSLIEIKLPDSTDCIGEATFKGCSSLMTFSSNSLQEIPCEAFYNCSALERVELNENIVNEFEAYAFYSCEALHDFVFPSSLRKIGEKAFANTKLENVELPDSLIYLGEGAFYECSSLISVRLSKSINVINKLTFAKCNQLREVDFSDVRLDEIGDEAFNDCIKLKVVCFNGNQTKVAYDCFYGCYNLSKVIVYNIKIPHQNTHEFLEKLLLNLGLRYLTILEHVTWDYHSGLDAVLIKVKNREEEMGKNLLKLVVQGYMSEPNTITVISSTPFKAWRSTYRRKRIL